MKFISIYNCLEKGNKMKLYYILMIYLIINYANGLDDQNDESQESYTQSSHKRGRHNHNHHNHNRHNHNRHKIKESLSRGVESEDNSSGVTQMARNRRDFESSHFLSRPSDDPNKSWKQKLVPPLNPSLFTDQSFNKSSRKRNNSSVKQPNIIFILTDDQDIELGKYFKSNQIR